MKNSINIMQDQGEIVVTIKLPMDQFINPLLNLLNYKINELNKEFKEVIDESDDTLCRLGVCRLLHISETTMTKRLKEGTIPYSRIGRRLVFSRKAVLEAIKKTQ